MKVESFIASRPVLIFVLLAFVVLLLPSTVIPLWYKTTKRIENDVGLISQNFRSELMTEIKIIENFLNPINSSAIKLATVLDSSLNKTSQPSFYEIKYKIVPVLFQAYTLIPYVSQVSYVGPDGLFFAFFVEKNQTFALFSNSSFPSGSSNNYTWYVQRTDQETGNLQGEALKCQPLDATNTTWFRGASDGSNGFAGLGTGWARTKDWLFLNSVSLYGKRGVVSVGFPVKALTDFFTGINLNGGNSYLSTVDGKMLVHGQENASFIFSNNSVCFGLLNPHVENVQCVTSNDASRNNTLEIGNSTYWVYCHVLEIAGVPLVSVSMFPRKGLQSQITSRSKSALVLLSVMLAMALILIFAFFFLMIRAAKREMHLCATLINQMEATQQAERKSMNKSLAFASASHDIRASLAGIKGLIELCYEEVDDCGSELETNLKQMQGCTKDLVALLNSILDMSKIEAGKMQLDEEDFNIAELLEEVVDSFHPVGMKKGVDVVLDPQDCSILRFSHVRGDRGKLKQILNNLISNAVKFTSEGHVSLRAWAQKPSSGSSVVLASNRDENILKCLPFLFCKKKGTCDVAVVGSVRSNLNSMEFVFEVDDTGRGIPKDRQKSVFENYVQVRETAQGQEGTGLGLGIVQSLVRLMGGEIRIVDKEIGQKGTCFRFNTFLTTSESASAETTVKQDIEANGGDCLSTTPNLGLKIQTSTRSLSIRSLSPRLNNILLNTSPKTEGSRVVLLIKNEERRRIAQNYFENLGINVTAVDKSENFIYVLKRIKSKLGECGSRIDFSSSSSKEAPLSSMEGTDCRIQMHKRRSGNVPGFVLLVIDANASPFSEIHNAVEWFRGGLHGGACCRVVWLNRPSHRGSAHCESDISFMKPLHGSRLLQVIKMLPEFGGSMPQKVASELKRESSLKNTITPGPGNKFVPERYPRNTSVQERSPRNNELQEIAMQEGEASRNSISRQKYEGISKKSEEKVLNGKRVLLAEDHPVSAMLAKKKLKQYGASTVDHCVNGHEAVRLVFDRLREQRKYEASLDNLLPFDYIFMDCQMPEMDGYEATRLIREQEMGYGIHIPIIAVTAHESGSEQVRNAIMSGMDAHLEKELDEKHLVEAVRNIQNMKRYES